MTTTSTAVYWDPYDPAFAADPYPTYRRLREEAPLYYNEKYNFYAVSRFADCERGLPDWKTFSSAKGGILELIQSGIEIPPGTLIFEDPPIHDIHRKLLSRVFTPRRIAQLEPKVRDFCVRALDPLVGERRFDLIEAVGAEMPMRVIGMLLGIPEADQAGIRDLADGKLRTEDGGQMDFSEGAILSGETFGEYVDWRRENPSDDLMTDLLTAEFTDENGQTRTLTRDEVLTYVTVVAGAGNETTGRLIGWIGSTLARFPAARAELVADPSLIPGAIEEILRFEPPGPFIGRYVTQDVEFHGQTVPAGSAILFVAAAANRDEEQYPDPDAFDIRRRISQQLTFGLGGHYCLGAALARLEGRVAMDEILRRFPSWEVDWDSAKLAQTSTVRGWETLPLVVG
ncbi:cytochrome P450 [Frankia sp. CNm7]|uniref:Cytochrome P450 n=1 Tax=Frankia nepalensis TaxID=1836974 RepID=A0A937RE16_9ACTN|nr:cytochrome P450 [Frankia nepalensis]MBL7502760.1 cytochrome P450 [Frankia nepalensis]MBL7516417.1 cytochrome P450 [Frankia nepalensis]MBL7517969.1 cytochrome P450 [Frankia nepalensis]MBL7627265.1 cytochrome P450 [Frankia nepalensis]